MSILPFADLLELQSELHRRIEEAVDRRKRNDELFGDAAEGKPDLEALLVYAQVPKLMLQDDGHLFRILRPQPVGNPHALGMGVEGDVKMMVARQAFLGGVGEHAAHHAAQRLLGQKIVADLVGHGSSMPGSCTRGQPRQESPDANAAGGESHPCRRCAAVIKRESLVVVAEGSGGFCCQVPPNPA